MGQGGEAGPAKLDLALRTAADRNETGPLVTLAPADPVSTSLKAEPGSAEYPALGRWTSGPRGHGCSPRSVLGTS